MKMKQQQSITHNPLAWMKNVVRTHFYFFHRISPFWVQLSYFASLSSICFLALRASKAKTNRNIIPSSDLFFTSVSAVTVSSMSTVEMEAFSDGQLVVLTVFMFLGGEVLTSILGLHLRARRGWLPGSRRGQVCGSNRIEASVQKESPDSEQEKGEGGEEYANDDDKDALERNKSIRTLMFTSACYLFIVSSAGSTLISVYLTFVPTARQILGKKGLRVSTFSVFTAVSTFVNCGFVPTNENMMAFKKFPGILLVVGPLVLLGNTMYPVCLRLTVWALRRCTGREEYEYILKNSSCLGYDHLLTRARTAWLAATVLGLVAVQMVVFCALEWDRGSMKGGLSGYERFVGSLFQVVNSRHAGESVFDLSEVSSAVLVMFVFMMYLPPYTSFLPSDEAHDEISTIEGEKTNKNEKKKENIWTYLKLSQLSYLLIFTILICITEREKMRSDPINFSVLNVVVEVISAYGNVGFSVGYSCERRINSEGYYCKDAAYGFAGRWSQKGKIVLIIVMFFGRLKKFSMRGGKHWNLS